MRFDGYMDDYKDKNVIYQLYNHITGKSYIGKTCNLPRRIKRHKYDSRTGKSYLYRSMRKHGANQFEIIVLCLCSDYNTLDDMERYCIRLFGSREFNNGYNLTDGGDGTKGYITTDKHRLNLSKSLKGRVISEETKQKISDTKKKRYVKHHHPNYRQHLSEETKQKISDSRTGQHLSEETKQKISDWSRDNQNRNIYKITFPDGITTTTRFLKKFCSDNHLTYSCMIKTARGERTHHKQFNIKRVQT